MSSLSRQTPSSSGAATDTAPPAPSLLDEILTKSEEAKKKVDSLREVTVRHSRFYTVFSQLAHQAQFAPPGHLIFVIGPTGAGKTTLAKTFATQLDGHFRAVGTSRGQIPVIYMNLKLEQSKGFVWRRYYLGTLRELDEPLLDKKVDLAAELAKLRNAGLTVGPYAANDQEIGDLRDCLELQLDARKTRYVLTDEANLLAMTKDSRKDKQAQMEVLKSLAASAPTTRFVFFATSDALPLLHLSPQLSRRVLVIRFEPYGDTKDELIALGSALLPYLQSVPNGYAFDLSKQIKTIQRTTSGLYGATAEWVQRATAEALLAERPLSWNDMEKAAPDPQTIASLKRDVLQFRAFFSEAQPQAPSPEAGGAGEPPKRRPGTRKPKRDARVSATTQ
jgi:DNA polymerase III delta prime subunit